VLIKFKDFDTEATSLTLSDKNLASLQSLLLSKINLLNRNLDITSDMIEASVFVMADRTKFYVPKNHKDFLSINVRVQFFEIVLNMNLFVYFDEKGKFHHYATSCNLSSSYFLEKLKLDQLGVKHTNIEFNLDIPNRDEYGHYKLIKVGNFKFPNLEMPIISIEYSFNNNHEIDCKCLNLQSSSSGSSMPVHIFEKIDTEIMFIKFLEYVIKERDACDKQFLDVTKLDFQKSEWIKIIHESFYKNLIGYHRQEFLNYLTVIEMSGY